MMQTNACMAFTVRVYRRARQRLCWAFGLCDTAAPAGAQLDYEIGVTVVSLAMEHSRYRYWEEVMPLQRTDSGNPTSDSARENQRQDACRTLRAASDPHTLRCAIAEAGRFEELAPDVASAQERLSTLERRVEDRVQMAVSARKLDAVIALLHEVDGWQGAGKGSPAAGWVARLNEAAASILDEQEALAVEPK